MTTPAYPDTRLLIDNAWVDAQDGRTLDVRNPATGAVIGRVAHAGIVDLDRRWRRPNGVLRCGATPPPKSAPPSCAVRRRCCANARATLPCC